MRTYFPELVRFEFQHEYFNNEQEPFTFQPQKLTLRLLKRSGLLFRSNGNGFTILYQAVKDQNDALVPLRKFNEQMSLRFWICPKSHYIGVVSQLPLFNSTAETLYFDNLADRAAGTTLFVNRSAPTVTTADKDDLFPLAPISWRYGKASTQSVSVRVQSAQGTVIKAETCWPHQGYVNCLIDLNGVDPGLISITPGTEDTSTFYCCESLPESPPLAAVDLYSGPRVPGPYAFVDGGGLPQPKTFTCRIARRSSTWRYVVVPRFNTSLNPAQLSIEDADARFTFGNPAAVQSMNGESAFAIESTLPIPHQAEPIRGLSLKRNNTDLITELPNPGPDQIRPSGGGFLSEIYVFV